MRNSHHPLDQSGQFNDSFVMQPINLNSHNNKLHSHKNSQNSYLSVTNFGQYEQYKLNHYVDRNQESTNYFTKSKLISIVSLDPQSLVLSENVQFQQLLKRYSVYDIVFVAVNGKKQSGKSFFCDKILNLAQIKGNHYCRNNSPALNVFETPFFKGDLCIFLVEVSGCEFSSKAYDILTTISLLLASSVVYVNKNGQKNKIQEFNKKVSQLINKIQFKNQSLEQKKKFLPKTLFNLIRKRPQEMQLALQPKKTQYFSDIFQKALPNAMTPTYKGKNSDLYSCSFLTRQCINQNYIKQVSKIFKNIVDHLQQKSYNDLQINGNIIIKLLSSLVIHLNARKTIKIQLIYQQIIRDLYVSAYNYCVISYQKQLQEYFGDEKAKNKQQMLQTFQQAANATLQRFNQFNLSKDLFHQYEDKLIKHMNEKQLLIIQINKQKTYDQLDNYFKNKGGKHIIKALKQQKQYLNHGRQIFINDKIQQLSKTSNSVDLRISASVAKLSQQVQKKKSQLERVKIRNSDLQKLQKKNIKTSKNNKNKLIQISSK